MSPELADDASGLPFCSSRSGDIWCRDIFLPQFSKDYLACKTNFYFTQVLHTSLKYLFLDGIIDTNDENINYNA